MGKLFSSVSYLKNVVINYEGSQNSKKGILIDIQFILVIRPF